MAEKRTRGAAGFSLLEVVAVLVLFGVLAAFVMEDGDPKAFEAAAEAEVFKASLRFAQALAYAQAELPAGAAEVRWGLNVSGNSFSLARNGIVSTTIKLPGTNSATRTLPSGVSFTGSDIAFNFRGIPVDSNGAEMATTDYEISGGHHMMISKTVTVTQQTGFIQ